MGLGGQQRKAERQLGVVEWKGERQKEQREITFFVRELSVFPCSFYMHVVQNTLIFVVRVCVENQLYCYNNKKNR